MNGDEALRQIEKGRLHRVYLLHGEEKNSGEVLFDAYLAERIEREIIKAAVRPEDREMNVAVFESDPPAKEIAAAVDTIPFFGGNTVVLVRGTSLLKAARGQSSPEGNELSRPAENEDQELLRLIAALPEYCHLVFTTNAKVDKRRRSFKLIEKTGQVIETAPLKAWEIQPWLVRSATEKGKRLTPEAAEHLAAAFSLMPAVSRGLLDNELTKLVLYTGDRKEITAEDVDFCLAAQPEISVFALTSALSAQNTEQALRLFREQLSHGENLMRLVALMASEVRRLWQVKELMEAGVSAKEIPKRLGIAPFLADKSVRQVHAFARDALREAYISLAAFEREFKLGRIEAEGLEKVIISLRKK